MQTELKQRLLTDILSTPDIQVLNIYDRVGCMGYIDFIQINEVSAPLMRGIDQFNRPFFTLCADIIYEDGSIIPTFTTIFQRYSDSNLWHAAGHYRKLLNTEGGMNIQQIGLCRLLIKFGFIDFTDGTDEENIEKLRLCNYTKNTNGDILYKYEFVRPLRIVLSLKNFEDYK